MEAFSLRTDERGNLPLPLSTGKGVYHATLTIEDYPPITAENIFVFGDEPGVELEITLPQRQGAVDVR